MASSDWNNLNDSQLATLAAQMSSVLITGFASYGVTTGQATALKEDKDDFQDGLSDVAAAKAALASAVQTKDAERTTLLSNISLLANIIYNNPSVTPSMIAALGLAPRATTRTMHQPKVPQNLIAFPYASGDVTLKWSKGENVYGAVYIIEAKTETGDWEQVYSTTKQKATLSGYTPGVATWFRVRSARNNAISGASNESPIYHAAEPVTLSMAA
jgi:hypothetical protein